jgi:hypothetical protein
MNPFEFEEYVSELVNQLDCFKRAELFRNHRFQGVRQPGFYEIDIAFKVKLSRKINFFFIVECKNWKKPVDRPVIQKLIQTRDAISAHKAAVASAKGFTREAIEVAKIHGIALWVISKPDWHCIMGFMGPPSLFFKQYKRRRKYLRKIGFKLRNNDSKLEFNFVSIYSVYLDRFSDKIEFSHVCEHGSAVPPGSNEPGIDPQLATTELAEICGDLMGHETITCEYFTKGIKHSHNIKYIH